MPVRAMTEKKRSCVIKNCWVRGAVGMRQILFLMLFIGFLGLFLSMYFGKVLHRLYQRTRSSMEKTGRENLLLLRKNLLSEERRKPMWYRVEKMLMYSGLKKKYTWLSGPVFLTLGLLGGGGVFLLALQWGIGQAFMWLGVYVGILFFDLSFLRRRQMHKTGKCLMSFLDFLGNYSVTAGEITWIFEQICPFMEEPLKGALEECASEAKLTGDVGMSLLVLWDRLEHKQFREIVRNLEIGIRYLADFKALVNTCKRSLREYEKSEREEKGMVKEAIISMLLLFAMSLLSLLIVDRMVEQSVWHILFETGFGKGVLAFVAGLLGIFALQVTGLERGR